MAPRSFPDLSRTSLTHGRDSVLEVMARELQRSMDGLVIPGSPRPYYMQYTLRRTHSLRIRAAYGSLVKSREKTAAQVYAECRVGSHKFDNVMDGGLDARADERESADWVEAPDDLDLAALQITLWKLTQLKFDEALQDYYDHRKALVTEYDRDEVDAFSREEPIVVREELHGDPFPRRAWEAMLRELSRRFLTRPDIVDPGVSLSAERVHRWLANTDGTRVVTEDIYVEVDLSGWVHTEDGVYTDASRTLYLRSIDDVPGSAELDRLIDELFAELDQLKEAPPLGSFIGPALLAGQAASTLFHEAMGHRLEGERRIARGETRTFAHKVGQRVLPRGLDVFDDPTMERFEGRRGVERIWGSYRVDDQGVAAQRATLVEDGILRGFLRSRTPIPQGDRSNGHGRHDGLQPPMARMSNLVVRPREDHGKSWDDLERLLIQTAKAQGRPQAMVILRINAGETATASYDFQVFKGEPGEAYVIDVETGARRRVRDVELIGTPLAALQRIVAFGREADLELDQGYCSAESGSIPVTGMAPPILLSEVEMQQSSTTGFHAPLLPPPFAPEPAVRRSRRARRRSPPT
jgi:TldD protein